MAIISHQGKFALFVHVPKAGGTSLEHLFVARYEHVGLWNTDWQAKTSYLSSFANSPMHISAADLTDLYPQGSVDLVLAVVRNPLHRLLSSYRYHQNKGLKRQFAKVGFSNWLDVMLRATDGVRSFTDNHLRPQTEMVPAHAEIFKLEEGLQKPADRVAEVLGPGATDSALTHANKSRGQTAAEILSRDDVDRITEFYAADYERFGYEKPDLSEFPLKSRGVFAGAACGVAAAGLAWAYKRRLIN